MNGPTPPPPVSTTSPGGDMSSDDHAPTFDRGQIDKYFDHIKLPSKYRARDTPPDLALLTALHVHHIAAIPYENLSLHYSPHKTVSLDPHDLYTKFIANGRNRGGYCMEGSLFFLHMLHSLGFHSAYPTPARIRLREDGVPAGPFISLSHIVLIINGLDGSGDRGSATTYVCDVAFGGDGPTAPMPLRAGVVARNLGAQEVRFAHERLPGTRSGQKHWVYQYRNGPRGSSSSSSSPWHAFYAFGEAEFLDADFATVNFFTAHAPTFQQTTVLGVKFVLGRADARAGGGEGEGEGEGEGAIVGKVMLVDGRVKRNMGGRTEVVRVCRTEAERIEALREWFGIELTDEERAGIVGTATELRDVEVLGA